MKTVILPTLGEFEAPGAPGAPAEKKEVEMNTHQPATDEQLNAARRRLCRRVASMLIRGMAETDTSYAQIAERMGVSEQVVKQLFAVLIAGTHRGLGDIADIATAMGLHMEIALHKIDPGEFEPRRGQEEAA